MYPVSQEFLDAIESSHTLEVLAVAYLDGSIVPGGEDLLVVEGSVRVDAKSKVRRAVESLKVVSTDGRTDTLRAILEAPGTEVQIYRGVRLPSGSKELAPIGRFVVDKVDDAIGLPGAVTVTAPDRAQRVIRDRFLTPRGGDTSKTIPGMIEALIQESIPGAVVQDLSGDATMVRSGVVWERERWDAIDELATSIGCVVYTDPAGDFVIAPEKTTADPADWTVSTGATGVLLDGTRSTVLEGVYNVVVATSAPTDGEAPVLGIAEDTNPLSPTRVDGPLGRVPRFYSSPLLATNAQALSAAQSILARALGLRGSLELSTLVNPALEAGDRVDVVFQDGSSQRHIVDSFAVPLTVGGSMTLSTRATEPEETSS